MFIEDPEPIITLIEDIRRQERIDQKINDALLLIETIGEELTQNKEIKKNQNYLTKLINNTKFRRKIKKYNKIMESQTDALLYLGKDYAGEDDYTFKEELEEEFIKIEKTIRNILSHTMQQITNQEIQIN